MQRLWATKIGGNDSFYGNYSGANSASPLAVHVYTLVDRGQASQCILKGSPVKPQRDKVTPRSSDSNQ